MYSLIHIKENYPQDRCPDSNTLRNICFRIIPKIFLKFLPKRACHICYHIKVTSVKYRYVRAPMNPASKRHCYTATANAAVIGVSPFPRLASP